MKGSNTYESNGAHNHHIKKTSKSKQYLATLNNISNQVNKHLQANNKEISSILLNSKGFFTPSITNQTSKFTNTVGHFLKPQNSEKLENIKNFSLKKIIENQKNLPYSTNENRNLLSKDKLLEDKALRLSSLTFRQDISHLLDSGQNKNTLTSRDFFKDRAFSLPFVKLSTENETFQAAIDSQRNPLPITKEASKHQEFENTKNSEKMLLNELINIRKSPLNLGNCLKEPENNISKIKTPRNLPLAYQDSLNNENSIIRVKTPQIKKNQEEIFNLLKQDPSKKMDGLKKEFPSTVTANPSGRLEVIIVFEWLENSLKVLSEKRNIDELERTKKIWEIFEVSYKEIERQMLFECNERGKLLMKLWEILKDLKLKDKENYENETLRIEANAYDEYNRLHSMYRAQLMEKDEIIAKYDKQVFELNKENIFLKTEKDNVEQREHQLTKKLSENNRMLLLYKKKLKIISSENEKLLYKVEAHPAGKTMSLIQNIQKDKDDKSSEESKEDDEKLVEEEFDQTFVDLNRIAITGIPDKPRSELFHDKETMVDNELKQLYMKDETVQSELSLMGEIYDKVMIHNKALKEMAEDFYYKKEVEDEEFMKMLNDNYYRLEKQDKKANKEELDSIKQKLKEFRDKHKNDNKDNSDSPTKEPQLIDKLKGALSKLRAIRTLKSNDEYHETRNEDELDKIMIKTEVENKEYETEEEESENEAKNDEQRQNIIIKELNHETSGESLSELDNPSKRIKKNINFNKVDDHIISSSNEKTPLYNEGIVSLKNLDEKHNEPFDKNEENEEPFDKNEENEINNENNENDENEENINHNKRFKGLKIKISNKNQLEPMDSLKSSSSQSSKKDFHTHKHSKDSIISSFSGEKNSKNVSKSEFSRNSLQRKNSVSPNISRNSSALLRNHRNSFQINLRHSMEPEKIISKRSSIRKSSMNSNQIYFNFGGKSMPKDMIEEIEAILTQGIQEIPQETANYAEALNKYMKSKNDDLPDLKEKENYFKLLLLYKTENKKAISVAEKCKRANDLLEMESMHRANLEEKHKDLLNNFNSLQEEVEKLRGKEKELNILINERDMKAKKILEKLPSSMEISQKIDKKDIRKPGRHPTRKKLPKETIAISPKLGQKVNIEYKSNSGTQLLEKIKMRKMKKFENFMHIKLVLKQIYLIYSERINTSKENELSKQMVFANAIYYYYLGLFGLKKIADRRFIIFVLSLKKYSNYFRITFFSRLFGLFDEKTNYSIEEFNKYIEALDFCTNISTMGVPIVNPESESKFYIPYIRALQYTGLFADTRMTTEENQHLKQEIENLKEPDPKGVNKAGIIDFDLFMERMLSKYRHLVNKAKTYVINAFAACDLDGNKMCNLEEFLLLNRHIEKDKYDKPALKKIFNENADIDNDGEKNLSFDKFSVLCVDYNLFSDEAQNRYLKITKKSQLEIKMEEVKISWYGKKFQLIDSFDKLTVISKESRENWLKIIEVLEERIMGNYEDPLQLKPTLIAYNILIEENELLSLKQENHNKGIDEEDDEEEEEEEEDEKNTELVSPTNKITESDNIMKKKLEEMKISQVSFKNSEQKIEDNDEINELEENSETD